MARRPRLDTAGAWHHVMNRGAGRRRVFSEDGDRHIFTDLLGALDRDFGVQTHAFCLMENHYHLLLRSSSGELSAAMQHLSANFTRHVNHRRGTDGPIFRGRFHSVSVDRDEQLREVCRYIHRNPVDAGFDGRLERYRWSSLGAYLGRHPVPHFLHVDEVLGWFGGDPQRLATFVARGEPPPSVGRSPSDAATAGPGPSAEPQIRLAHHLAAVDRAVAAAWGRRPEEIHATPPGSSNPARLAADLLALDRGLPAADVARLRGRSASSVRSSATRARRLAQHDPRFANRIAAAAERLEARCPIRPDESAA